MIDATRINGWLWPKMAALRAGFSRWSRKVAQLTFSTDDRILLYEDLAFLLDNRIPIKTALSSMRDTLCRRQKRQPPTVHCLNDAIAALNSGGSLDQGLKGWLPTNETAILSAGVKEKRIAPSLRRAVAIVTVMGQIKRTLWEKLSAPLLLMAGIVALATLLSWDFLPKMENLSPRENWTGAMRGLSLLSDGIGQHLPLIVVILLMLTGWTVWSLPNMTGLLRKKVLDNLPPWSLYREIQGVAFMLNYSALTRAQVNAEGALLLLMNNASPWLHERLRETLKLLRRGRNLGQALDQNGYHFPSRHAIDRLILLTSGDHAEAIIENFAHNQLDKALKKITALASRLQLILYLLAGLYMGLVAYSTQNLSMMGS